MDNYILREVRPFDISTFAQHLLNCLNKGGVA